MSYYDHGIGQRHITTTKTWLHLPYLHKGKNYNFLVNVINTVGKYQVKEGEPMRGISIHDKQIGEQPSIDFERLGFAEDWTQ